MRGQWVDHLLCIVCLLHTCNECDVTMCQYDVTHMSLSPQSWERETWERERRMVSQLRGREGEGEGGRERGRRGGREEGRGKGDLPHTSLPTYHLPHYLLPQFMVMSFTMKQLAIYEDEEALQSQGPITSFQFSQIYTVRTLNSGEHEILRVKQSDLKKILMVG